MKKSQKAPKMQKPDGRKIMAAIMAVVLVGALLVSLVATALMAL